VRDSHARIVFADRQQSIRLMKRKRPQKHSVYHAEHGRGHTYAQSNGYDRSRRKTGVAPQLPEREIEILNQSFHNLLIPFHS
jgi:hypothetical protein